MFRKKCFLDMQNAKIISQSIVLMDTNISQIPLQPTQISVKFDDSPFFVLANTLVLKSALGINFADVSQTIEPKKSYKSNDIDILYSLIPYPPRLEIKYTNSEKKYNKAIELATRLIEYSELTSKVGRVGINYEFFISNNINLKDKLLQNSVAKEFSNVSTTLQSVMSNGFTLNLIIQNAKTSPIDGILIQVNFDIMINEDNKINDIFKKDYYKIIKNKVESIFD